MTVSKISSTYSNTNEYKEYFVYENVFIFGDAFFKTIFSIRIFFLHENLINISDSLLVQKMYLKTPFGILFGDPM